ncbi:protein boule [Hydra vulgaris]|uniref:protein boule n=1 Tax=Hydra vulgaris TaxID=6087 RepID=UPI0002B4C1C3|nr:protein boule-like [Hydra vulgaris]
MNSCEENESNEEIADEQAVDLKNQDPYLRHSPGDVEIPNRIFVKGFSKETTEDDLINFFEIYGIVIEANIIRDKQGLSKGYGFVTFDSQTIAESVKLEGTVPFKDREVVIGHAKIRPIKFKNLEQYNSGCWYVQQQQPAYYSPDGVNFYLVQQQQAPPQYQQPVSFVTSPSQPLYPAEQYYTQQYSPPVPYPSTAWYTQQVPIQPTTAAPSSATAQIIQNVTPQQVFTQPIYTSNTLHTVPQFTTFALPQGYCKGVNTLTQSMNNMAINEQLIRRKEEGGYEYHSVIQTSPQSPAHVVPVAYESKIMHKDDDHINEGMPTNLVYLQEPTKMKTVHVVKRDISHGIY